MAAGPAAAGAENQPPGRLGSQTPLDLGHGKVGDKLLETFLCPVSSRGVFVVVVVFHERTSSECSLFLLFKVVHANNQLMAHIFA